MHHIAKPRDRPDLQARADAVIDFATKVKDWPLLEEAVDAKIADQEEFVAWWNENVGVRLRAGTEMNADRSSSLSKDLAEKHTGVLQQQVSRWRKHLADKPKYRERLTSFEMGPGDASGPSSAMGDPPSGCAPSLRRATPGGA